MISSSGVRAMFGWGLRQKVTDATIESLRPMLAMLQHHSGIPPHFWTDEFVLGFFGVLIGFHSRYASQDRLTQEDKGRVFIDVLTALSNMNGVELLRSYTSLAGNETPDFKLGGDRAMIIFGYLTGKLKNEQQYEEVVTAQRIAGAADRSKIGAILIMTLFINEVEKRFSE